MAIVKKLKLLKDSLKLWNQVEFGYVETAILSLEDELDRIDMKMESINLNDSLLKANLNSRRGIIWRQL